MADRKKRGIDFFRQGLGCAQAIMCAYAEELAISYEEAIRMSEEYAAGTYRVCGPVMAMHCSIESIHKPPTNSRGRRKNREKKWIRRLKNDLEV